MSKIAEYLNEHLLGEVSSVSTIREQYASDASVLSLTPEIVIFPKVTNDIRKAARFSWQLAEKGHVLGLTVRGQGGDVTGGAIGVGAVLDTSRYLNDILYVATKDKHKIAHVQPGVSIDGLNRVLKWHGLMLGGYRHLSSDMTIGGAIATGAHGPQTGKYRTIGDTVERLEVVLANGDVLETGRINKRELNKKKGEQTLEGEIYRRIDGIIDDNQELIDTISSEKDNLGYRIDKVRHKDGSFDLTPLFIGSQGTLGIISEAVIGLDFFSDSETVMVIATETTEEARDIADTLRQLEPASLQLIDGEYLSVARTHGKKYVIDETAGAIRTLVYVSFDDISDKQQDRKLKRARKLLAKRDVGIYTSDEYKLEDLQALRDVLETVRQPLRADETRVSICDGAYVPHERQEEFAQSVALLAEKQRIALPLIVDALSGVITTVPSLHLNRLADKQKIFKLASEYAALVHAAGGTIAGRSAEGRLHALTAYPVVDTAVTELYDKVRQAFDPYGTLNPGVKQSTDIKTLAHQLKKTT